MDGYSKKRPLPNKTQAELNIGYHLMEEEESIH